MRLTGRKCKRSDLTRKKEIDRDRILDAPRCDPRFRWPKITLDAVASVGDHKGGLVYTFATKDGLVRRRWSGKSRALRRGEPAAWRQAGRTFRDGLAHIEERVAEDDARDQQGAFW